MGLQLIVLMVMIFAWPTLWVWADEANPKPDAAGCQPATQHSTSETLEGIQIETSNMEAYESLFLVVLRATLMEEIEHPGMDRLRGYCYRGMMVVVRQDLRTPRPTGWVQMNFAVSNVEAVMEDLERAYHASALPLQDQARGEKSVRFRLKPDVRRGNCRASRLEVMGPEGFMLGFNHYKEGTCSERGER